MGVTTSVPTPLLAVLADDEDLLDAARAMRPGMATTVPGSGADPAAEIGLDGDHDGWLVLTTRRLLLARRDGHLLHGAALSGIDVDHVDLGRAHLRVRRMHIAWDAQRWSLLDMPTGLWRAARVEAFTTALRGARDAAR